MDNEEQAFKFYENTKVYMNQAGFNLRKWQTNNANLQEEISRKECKLDNATNHTTIYYPATINKEPRIRKVLGVSWDVDSDCFVFDFGEVVSMAENLSVTKRSILKISAMFFDPLGVISPIVLQFKLLFKRLCCIKSDWDNEVPPDVSSDFKSWLAGMSCLLYTSPSPRDS